MEIPVSYKSLCPVCGKNYGNYEIEKKECSIKRVPFAKIFENKEFSEFKRFFEEKTGKKMSSLQRYWAIKLSEGNSFAAVAPTGVGKTLFGITYAYYTLEKGKSSYILVPTTLLLNQVVERLKAMGCEDVLFYKTGVNKDALKEEMEKRKNYIFVSTVSFLSKNFEEMLKGRVFDFIFVDDVDAILKASKNVEKVLMLMGFTQAEIIKGEPKRRIRSKLMVSTATAKPGKKALLFQKLLNFTVGSSKQVIREVIDIVSETSEEKIYENVAFVVNKLGHGALIFCEKEEIAEEVYNYLKEKGIDCGLIVSKKSKKEIEETISKFLNNEALALIGVCSPYGLLVRGLDYPKAIKYAVFVRIPNIKVGLKDVDEMKPGTLLMVGSIFRKKEDVRSLLPFVMQKEWARERLKEILKEIFEKEIDNLKGDDFLVENRKIVIPNIPAYIQASGRTSRLYPGGITKGFSIVFDSKERLDVFCKRARYYDIEIERKGIKEIDFEKVKAELEESRKFIDKSFKSIDPIKPVLFVVESPTKAKHISRFFGKPAVNLINDQVFYEVNAGKYILIITASLGHLVDLVENEAYHGVKIKKSGNLNIFEPIYGSIKKCRNDNTQFINYNSCPICGSKDFDDAKKRILNMMKIAFMTGNVIIASDPDTEGEKIAWDVSNFSNIFANVRRAEFHEITKKAVWNAINDLQSINENRVKAQIVRRVEDRWIGFELSKLLQFIFRQRNLSAGRAQTPVLGWVIEHYNLYKQREKEYLVSFGEENISISIGRESELEKDKVEIFDELSDLKDKENVLVEINLIEEKEEEQTPLPPYTTDTLLKDINRILKIPSKQAMQILQQLFENGLITYHRTDSTRVSDKGIEIAKEYLGKEYFKPRRWGHDKDAQGAHECIRVTKPFDRELVKNLIFQGVIRTVDKITRHHLNVYDLIFRRFMASQCVEYTVKKKKYEVIIKRNEDVIFRKELEILTDVNGKAYELYPYAVKRQNPLPTGTFKANIFYKLRRKGSLLTEADLIGLMKERGIGRPSTYATIVDKLFKRGYVFEKNGKLIPTRKGMRIYEFLSKHFTSFVSEERTRIVEEIMDKVEEGKADYMETLNMLYKEIQEEIVLRSKNLF